MRREFVFPHPLEIVVFTLEVVTLAFGSVCKRYTSENNNFQASKYVMYVLLIEAHRFFMRHDKVCYYQLSIISWSFQAVLCTKLSEANGTR